MRPNTVFALLAAGTALVAGPAAAQLLGTNAGAGVGVGVNTGVAVDTGRVLDRTVDTADRAATRAVNATGRLATRTIAGTRVALATSADVRTGTEVRDSRGQRVGTVQQVSGNAAVVASGQKAYHVPLASLYRTTSGKARTLYTSVPRAQLTGHVNAQANARSAVHAGH